MIDHTQAFHIYLEMVGHLVIAWLWLRQAEVAVMQIKTVTGVQADFYRGKLQACAYFFNWELPKVSCQANILVTMESTSYDMQNNWF